MSGGDGQDRLEVTASANRRRFVVLGGVLAVGAVIGGTAWAATSFFATGAQPAEALPASTIAYASIDLDPNGAQKVEAIRTLRKFPAFTDAVDLETDDDLRERFFTEALECEGLDYERDVAPWLGSRAAVAAVDAGEEQPSPVGVLQITDRDKAEDGIANLIRVCGGGADEAAAEPAPWVVTGDWVVVAENREIAQGVVDDTEQASLADDGAYDRWTSKAGDDGIISLYVAKAASAQFDDLVASRLGLLGLGTLPDDTADSGLAAIEDFQGMALTVRFDDGALEIESATSANPDQQEFFSSSVGVDLVASLPDDTLAALGLGLEDGWVDMLAEQFVASEGGEASVEDFYEEGGEQLGLELPDDLEKLFGEGLAVALGSGIDPDAFANGGPLELPIGVKVKADAGDVQDVVDKLRAQLSPDEAAALELSASGDHVALSPDDDLREALVSDGSLGDNEVFERVVEGADDAQGVLFVNFNADDDWLVRLADDIDPELAPNLEPLAAFGVSGWFEDGVAHALVKLTTD